MQELGVNVRKGEHGSLVVYANSVTKTEANHLRSGVEYMTINSGYANRCDYESTIQCTLPCMTKFTTHLWEKRGLAFAVVMGVFCLITIPMGVIRPLWYDELAARWLAEATSIGEFVDRINTGVEPTPPLYLLVQYLSVHLFGAPDWTGRLPSMLGYAASLTFLYLFVARRLAAIGGAIAMAIMMLTGTLYYAQEGRPYGMVFGCAALAMWAWQEYIEQERPRYAALCGVALFAAASLHYYSVLLSVPFGLAEVLRIWKSRRLDWKMVLVTAAPGIALLVHLPIIRMILSSQSNPEFAWAKPTLAFPAKFWLRALEPTVFVFVAVAVLILYLWRSRTVDPAEPKTSSFSLPDAELALLIGFVLIPIAGTIFAKVVTNAIAPRYIFSTMLGFSALLAHVLMRAVPAGRSWIFLILLAAVAGNGLLDIRWSMRDSLPGQLEIPVVTGEPALPVVVDDYLLYAQLGRYASPELLSRLVYLTDLERLKRYTSAGQMEMITVIGVKKGQLRGQSGYLTPFLESNSRFLLFEPLRAEQNESWLSHDLLDRGVGLKLIAIQGGGRWYLVERK